MKTNIIKRITFLILIILTFNSLNAQRNTLWMRGTSQNSNGWDATKSYMLTTEGYQFNDLIFSNVYNPSLGVEGSSDALVGTFGSNNDILGIAHDFGGLVLRDLQLQEPKISAMILDGVPNQGSSAISFATLSDPGDISRAEKLVNIIQQIQEGNECEFCDLVEEFESWVASLNAGSTYLCDAKSNSSVINNLNNNMPTVPFAIMWGSVEDFSITRLMSSRAFPSDGDYFTECYTQQLEMARQETKDNFIRATINNVGGFFGSIASFIGSLLPDDLTPTQIISSVVDLVNATRTNTLNEIEAVKNRDQELARILRCEFSNQLLAAEWQLGMLENSFQTEEVEYFKTEAQCRAECEAEGWEDFYLEFICIPDCMEELQIGTVIVADDNDGLLTKSEQLLEGAEKVYHLPETNHFQETRVDKPPVVNALIDLFEGGAGAAFIIPK